jgi:hypothetical protein
MYQVSFPQEFEYLNGEYELADVIDQCVEIEEKAELYTLQGFRAGWVYPDGSWALT